MPSGSEHLEPERRSVLEDFAARRSVLARTRRLDEIAVEAIAAFDSAGIGGRVLKGIVLSRLLYREREARGYFDIDLMVNPGQLNAAGEVLTTLGYQNMSALDGIVDVAGILHAQMWAKAEAAVGNLTIDLHWTLAGCRADPERVWSVLAPDPTYISVVGTRLPALRPAALALHLALHAAQHGPDDLKAIGDLRRGVERWSPEVWRDAASLAEQVQAADSFGAGLRLTPAGARLADDVLNLDQSALRLAEIEARSQRPRGTFHLSALTTASGANQKWTVVRHALFPTRRWIERDYRWSQRSGVLLPLAYGLHLLRSPGWAARAWLHRRAVGRRAAGRG